LYIKNKYRTVRASYLLTYLLIAVFDWISGASSKYNETRERLI